MKPRGLDPGRADLHEQWTAKTCLGVPPEPGIVIEPRWCRSCPLCEGRTCKKLQPPVAQSQAIRIPSRLTALYEKRFMSDFAEYDMVSELPLSSGS